MPSSPLPYQASSYLPTRFFNLARILSYSCNGYTYEENQGEKIATAMLWPIEKMPSYLKDPKVVTLAVSSLALLVDSFLFYPEQTTNRLNQLKEILIENSESIRFVSYLLSVETILGYTLRAESRLANAELMDQVYSQK